jgi:hypothetical protein
MDFVETIKREIAPHIDPSEGNCGICHRTLRAISKHGGYTVAWERPEGIRASIINAEGEVVGEGEGITWPPALLFAMVEAGFYTQTVEKQLMESLQCLIDMEEVSKIYGYGRVVTPVAAAYNEIWDRGGKVVIRRKSWGIEVIFIDKEGRELCVGPISYCPTCGTAAALPRMPELAEKIRRQLEGAANTGYEKYKRGIENRFFYKNNRVCCEIIEKGDVLGRASKCCIAYSGVCAEIDAGLSSSKWAELFKHYCQVCPTRMCKRGEDAGRMGYRILGNLEEKKLETNVKMNNYITALVKKGERELGEGIGTVCALTSLINAAATHIELKKEIEIIIEE